MHCFAVGLDDSQPFSKNATEVSKVIFFQTMTSSNQVNNWESLSDVPDVSSSHFIIIFNAKKVSLYTLQQNNALTKYSFNTNKWHRPHFISQLQRNFFGSSKFHPATIDFNTNTVYLMNHDGKLATLKIKDNNQIKANVMHNLTEIGYGAKGIIINDIYHIIGGYKNSKHLTYNPKIKRFDVLHRFENKFGIHGMIKIKHKLIEFVNMILYRMNGGDWS